jgi:UPF0716 family protein affecting phage T7 exclusion
MRESFGLLLLIPGFADCLLLLLCLSGWFRSHEGAALALPIVVLTDSRKLRLVAFGIQEELAATVKTVAAKIRKPKVKFMDASIR